MARTGQDVVAEGRQLTVIAWDGTTLAADKRMNNLGWGHTTTKIQRLGNDMLAASMGDHGATERVLAWIRAGRDPEKWPDIADDSGHVLLFHRDGRVERFENGPYPALIEDRCVAGGHGRDYALAAMYLGCDAVRAVEVASALDVYCGHGVDTLTFEEAV